MNSQKLFDNFHKPRYQYVEGEMIKKDKHMES